MREVLCGLDTDMVYLADCERMQMATYADVAADAERRDWLIAHGCPPPMVEPSKHVGADEVPVPSAPPTAAPVTFVPGPKDGFDPQAIHQLRSVYDEFKDRTTTSSSIALAPGTTLYLFAISGGPSPSGRVTTMSFGISEESEKPKHVDAPSLIFLVGGRRVVARELSRQEAPVAGGRILETVSTSVSIEDLRSMLAAPQVRGQLDSTEFAFSPQAMADIRAFSERVGAVAPLPTVDGSEYSPPKVSK